MFRFWVCRVDVFEELGEEVRRILAVGVHSNDEVARSVFEACEEGGLFIEVARKGNIENTGVVVGKGFDDFESVISTAVINKDKFKIVVRQSVDRVDGFLIKERERFGLVVAGNYDTNLFLHYINYSIEYVRYGLMCCDAYDKMELIEIRRQNGNKKAECECEVEDKDDK